MLLTESPSKLQGKVFADSVDEAPGQRTKLEKFAFVCKENYRATVFMCLLSASLLSIIALHLSSTSIGFAVLFALASFLELCAITWPVLTFSHISPSLHIAFHASWSAALFIEVLFKFGCVLINAKADYVSDFVFSLLLLFLAAVHMCEYIFPTKICHRFPVVTEEIPPEGQGETESGNEQKDICSSNKKHKCVHVCWFLFWIFPTTLIFVSILVDGILGLHGLVEAPSQSFVEVDVPLTSESKTERRILNYWCYDDSINNNTLVLFEGGYGSINLLNHHYLEYLSETTLSCTYDAAGTGFSSDTTNFTFSSDAANLHAVAQHIFQQENIPREDRNVVVLGFSRGWVVSATFKDRYGEIQGLYNTVTAVLLDGSYLGRRDFSILGESTTDALESAQTIVSAFGGIAQLARLSVFASGVTGGIIDVPNEIATATTIRYTTTAFCRMVVEQDRAWQENYDGPEFVNGSIVQPDLEIYQLHPRLLIDGEYPSHQAMLTERKCFGCSVYS